MNNKEFVTEIASKLGMSTSQVTSLMAGLTTEMASHFEEETQVSIMNFGNFEVKKKLERVIINPSTKQRMLVPPKMALSFKPSNMFKDKL
ncbi:MAG: HU family DNA-binding protein [Bacteroidaceae bacterium]|nr:HU family DNA-binding protein [Bacteroidaceae bacterium]